MERNKAWLNWEAVCVTKAYLAVSEDASVGVNRSRDDFYREVARKFNEYADETWGEKETNNLDVWPCHRGSSRIVRTCKSVRDFWKLRINKEVTLYCAMLASIKTNAPTGTTEAQLRRMVLRQWKDAHDNEFRFVECAELCLNHPRWRSMDATQEPSAQPREKRPLREDTLSREKVKLMRELKSLMKGKKNLEVLNHSLTTQVSLFNTRDVPDRLRKRALDQIETIQAELEKHWKRKLDE